MRRSFWATLVALVLFTTPAFSQQPEPFESLGWTTNSIVSSGIVTKWNETLPAIKDDLKEVADCEQGTSPCKPRHLQFLALVNVYLSKQKELGSGMGWLNQRVGKLVPPAGDLERFGIEDVWLPPLATLAGRGGDCEDYAILTFAILVKAGVPISDLRIVIVRNIFGLGDHAFVAKREHGKWMALDNRTLRIAEDIGLRRFYEPKFVLRADGVKKYEHTLSVAQQK